MEFNEVKFFLPTICRPQDFADHLDIPLEDATALFESGVFQTREVPDHGLVASKYAILVWLENKGEAALRVLPRGEDGGR